MKVIVVVLSLVLFAACVRGQDQGLGGRCVDKLETCDPNVNQITNRFEFRYSKQVKELIFTNTYVDISVEYPNASNPTIIILSKYRFTRCGCEILIEDDRANLVFPVEDMFLADTINMALLAEIPGGLDKLTVISTDEFVSNEEIHERVESGQIQVLGSEPDGVFNNLFNQTLLPSRPSLTVLDYFSVGAFDTALEAAIERRGRVIRPRMFVNPETVETTPLGRAETVLFYGLFTNRIAAAKTAFAEIETAYNARRDAAFTVARQPSTMLNTPFVFDDGFSWSFPGGDSYTAAFLRDANVDYRFQSNGATTSTTFIAPAEIFSNFASADYWINIAKFQDQFENVDAVLADLAAAPINMNGSRFESIQCDNAWGNDKDLRSKGVPDPKGSANNYFELGVVRPDLILADLVDVFHPGAIPNHTMTFYRKIPRGSNTLVCPLADLPATAPAGQALTTTSAVATGTNRFDIEDILVDTVVPSIAEVNNVSVDNVEVNLRTLRNAASTAEMNITILSSEADAPAIAAARSATLQRIQSDLRSNLEGGDDITVRFQLEPTAVPTAEPTAVPTGEPTGEPTSAPTTGPTEEPTPTPSEEAGGSGPISAGAIVGIVLGSLAFLCCLLLLCILFTRRRTRSTEEEAVDEAENADA